MTIDAREPLLLSGIQHFTFCRRQWALIHIEQQWIDNAHTVMGDIFHERAHDGSASERRGDLLILRGMDVFSRALNVAGKCDVVEFRADPGGVALAGHKGLWQPYPVEYKKGSPKAHDADEMQLCAQAMCLEEMLLCDIPEGSLFYGEPHRRQIVAFSDSLRERVRDAIGEMNALYQRGYTPRTKQTKACASCSLRDICLPGLVVRSASEYVREHLEEVQTCDDC